METTITTCGWVLFGLLTAALTIFAVAFLYGCGFLGYRLSSRLIRERKWWKKAVRQGDHRITHYAAVTMSDRLGYGEAATLGGTSETQTKITQPDMTTEEKAKAYAENIFGNPITPRGIEETRVARNAYLAGATEALASQWKDPKVELPGDDRQVLVETDCEDKELRHAISYFLAGAWHFPDDWYYDCRVLKWMYIPPLKGGEE